MKLRRVAFIVMLGLFSICTALPAVAKDSKSGGKSGAKVTTSVPTLTVRWDCGECPVNDKVIPLILKNYEDIARSKGVTIVSDEVVDAAIVDFRQRPPAARAMLGALAGKDKLGLKYTYKDKEFVAEDYYANIAKGMNALCLSIATKIFKQVNSVN